MTGVVIIGAGPAGLTAAYELTRAGVGCVVLEMGQRVGGLARTEEFRGYRVDIGGHRFFTKSPEVLAFWHEVLGSEMLTRPRLSRIYYGKQLYAYPLRVGDALSKLGPVESVRIAASYARSMMFPRKPEDTFEDWVSNRFGDRLYQHFFKSYTEKVWGIPCNEISATWAAQRIQSLSLPRAVLNALVGDRAGHVKSLIQEFEYPRLGPGMLWEEVARRVEARGSRVVLGAEVTRIEHAGGHVNSVDFRREGLSESVQATAVISTMPISQLVLRLDPSAPDAELAGARGLGYRDFLTVALVIRQAELFPDNWIYIHEPDVRVGRIQNFKNWSPDMVPDPARTCLGLEYFCQEGDDLWAMGDDQLVALATQELDSLGLASTQDVVDGLVIRQPKAYPVYTGEYEGYLATIRALLDQFDNLQTIGRNGLHMYNNQDHAMLTAMLAARNVLGEDLDVWAVNVERSYHEEMRMPQEPDSPGVGAGSVTS